LLEFWEGELLKRVEFIYLHTRTRKNSWSFCILYCKTFYRCIFLHRRSKLVR